MSQRAAHSRDRWLIRATLAELYYLINNDSGEIDKIGITDGGLRLSPLVFELCRTGRLTRPTDFARTRWSNPPCDPRLHACHAQIARRANLPQPAALISPPNQIHICNIPCPS